MSALEAAQVLGKYAIVRELGRGGFATVYLAQDTVLRRNVALKILHPALLSDPIFVQRFEQEAHATAQLDYPHIATIFDLGQLEGRLYIAMRLLSGGTLADRLRQAGPLPFAQAARVIAEIGGALDHAHTAGFVHRDVKPTNILFDTRGAAVLADFGMVKAVESSVIARTTMGNVIGTPAYIAPEVWEGQEGGPATDVYALGCVLFEMLTGHLLFKGSTPPAVMLAHFRPHEYPAQWPPGVPPPITAVLEQALARDPAARFASAGALADALHGLSAQPADRQTPSDQASDEPAGQVAQWRDATLEAERGGQIDAARAAARRWLESAPHDAEAQALLARLDSAGPQEQAPDRNDMPGQSASETAQWKSGGMVGERPQAPTATEHLAEPVLSDQEAGPRNVEPQPDVRDTASRSEIALETAQPIPASDRDTARIPGIWKAIALAILAWSLSLVMAEYITSTGGWTLSAVAIGGGIGGGLGGSCLGYISCLIVAQIRTKHILLIAAGWAATGLVFSMAGLSISSALDNRNIGWVIGVALDGFAGGIITALVLRRAMPALPSRVTYILPIGWSIGLALGVLAARIVAVADQSTSQAVLFGAVYGAVAGAIGGGVMFWAISRARPSEVAPQLEVGDAARRTQAARQADQLTPARSSSTIDMPQIWMATALTIVTWTLSNVFYEYIAMAVWTREAAQVGSFLGGAIAGFCLGYISRLISVEIHTKHILLIAAGWAVAWLVRLEIGSSMAELLGDSSPISSWTLGEIMKSLIGGIITALILRRAMPGLPSTVMYLFPIGWGTGFALGGQIATAVGGPYEPTPRTLIFIGLSAAIAAAIGGGVMFWAIRSGHPSGARNETLTALLPVIASSVGAMIGAIGGGLIGQSLLGAQNGFSLGLMLGAVAGAIVGGTMFRRAG